MSPPPFNAMREMKNYIIYSAGIVCGLLLTALTDLAKAEERGMDNSHCIIPMPLFIKKTNNAQFMINAQTVIVHLDKESKPCADYLRNRIAATTGLNVSIHDSGGSNVINLKIDPNAVKFTEADAYLFESNSKNITITGKSTSGLFYGVQTLLQLLPV